MCQNDIQRPQQSPNEDVGGKDKTIKTEIEDKQGQEGKSLLLEPEFPLGSPHPLTGYQNYVDKDVAGRNQSKVS